MGALASLIRHQVAALRARTRVESIVEVLDATKQVVVARVRMAGSSGAPFGARNFARGATSAVGGAGVVITRVHRRP